MFSSISKLVETLNYLKNYLKKTSIKRIKFIYFFLYFRLLNQEHYLLEFYLLGFLLLVFSCILFLLNIKFRNSNKDCGIRYFTLDLCGFFIQSSFGNPINNARYFTFNLCSLCSKNSFCNQIIDIR